jgi:hypothetical protein
MTESCQSKPEPGERTTHCARSGGCGRVVGSGAKERPWIAVSGLPSHVVLEKVLGMQRPRPCPSCGGLGTPTGRP